MKRQPDTYVYKLSLPQKAGAVRCNSCTAPDNAEQSGTMQDCSGPDCSGLDCSGLDCTVHLSDRKSISIQVKEDASVHVRAPFYAGRREIEAFIEEKRDWIRKNHQKMLSRTDASDALTPLQKQQAAALEKRFRSAARLYFPKRCAELQKRTGGHYTKITIRNQKTRWGSCSQTGTLSFNYRLMMAPPEVIDYVIVHELCHLTHMNHSRAFWAKVEDVMPDYRRHRKWLKEHGAELTEARCLRPQAVPSAPTKSAVCSRKPCRLPPEACYLLSLM